MTKTKILYVSHSSRIGGAEVCLLTLIKYLDKNFFEPVVVFPTPGPLRKQIEQLGVRTYITPLEWWVRAEREFAYKGNPLSRRVQALARIIEREKPHIVHTNTSVIWEGALAAQLRGVPHLWHIHEILEVHPVLRTLFPLPTVHQIMDELSQRVVAVSEAALNGLVQDITASKLTVISNGIDTAKFKTTGNENHGSSLREELNLPADAILAITVGSLVAEKGHDNLLMAASLVGKRHVPVHFILVGGGTPPAVWALKKKIKELRLEHSVHYLGFRRDVPRLVKSCDFLVLPSHTDAFPLAVLEAMAAGKPVIATASGGAAEMIANGESGFLVPVANPHRLCDKILEIAADVEMRKRMGTSAFQRFNENFTAEIFAARFGNLYQEMLDLQTVLSSGESTPTTVVPWMKQYENLYWKSQAMARRRSPLTWQLGKIVRWAKQLARQRIYEKE